MAKESCQVERSSTIIVLSMDEIDRKSSGLLQDESQTSRPHCGQMQWRLTEYIEFVDKLRASRKKPFDLRFVLTEHSDTQ
jgi:hypothetical protein